MKKRIYKKIENGIEYLVFEAPDYSYFNKYYFHKLPKKYENMLYTKYVIFCGRWDINYYYDNLDHNLYGPNFIRGFGKSEDEIQIFASSYCIYGKKYDYAEWLLKTQFIYRKEKLKNINLVSLSTSQNL